MFYLYKFKISVKDINIKNHTYYFFDDIINMKKFNPNNFKIDDKLYKIILIYYIGYVTIKKDLNIFSVNPLYLLHLIFGKVNRYFEDINGNNYLTLIPTNQRKEHMKIKFDSEDELALNKTVEIPFMTIVVRDVFLENNEY